jgi:hypothetical protein
MTTKKKPAPKKGSAGKAASAKTTAATTKQPQMMTVTMAGTPTKNAIAPPERVSIEVLLPSSDTGLSPIADEEVISFSNIGRFRPAKVKQDQAARRMAELGFKIVAISPYSISVEGTPALFTKTFGTELEVRSIDRVQTGRPMREKAFFAPAAGAPWQPPTALEGVVERAYVQPPAIYFESALPPKVNYFHLNVPADVAMLTRASKVHQKGITGKGVRVVMIDSGFFNHKFYQSRGFKATVMLGPGATNVKQDENGHGGAEAANVFSTAPGVTFTMIKQGNNSTAAFKAAVALKPDIITCSWGFDLVDESSPTRQHLPSVPNTLKALEMEVAHAVASGICVVFSAGNGHVSFPGMHPDVISAGGVFVDPNQALIASNYASAFDSKPYPGRHVPDVCGLVGMQPQAIYIMLPLQPGCEIDTELASGKAFPNGDETQKGDGWSAISGTSAAAPQLAGICALLKQKKPSLTPQQIKQALMASARDCPTGVANDASNEGVALKATPGVDGATGHGLVDAAAAVEII